MANEPEHSDRIAALTTLRDLLIEERAALKARDHDAIVECAERKSARAGELQGLLPSLVVLDAAGPSERARIVELAGECSELNRGNGIMVAALRGVVDRALVIVRGEDAEAHSTVYGPTGNRLGIAAGRYAGSA